MNSPVRLSMDEWLSIAIEEFSLRLALPFAFNPTSSDESIIRDVAALTIPQWLLSLPIPDSLLAKITKQQEKGRSLLVWESSLRFLSTDLYPHIQRIFGAEAGTVSRGYVLSTDAWQAFTGDLGAGFGAGMQMKLSKGAALRLGMDVGEEQDQWLPFSVREGLTKMNPPRLHLFGSGIGVLELEISPSEEFLKVYGAGIASEFIHAICHLDRQGPQIRWAGSEAETKLQNVMMALVPGLRMDELVKPIEALVNGRLFSLACLRTSSLLLSDQARGMAYRLAHRQTSHYLPTVESLNQGLFVPFENIFHAMCTEGGALVICPAEGQNDNIEFNKRYIASVVKDAYWPLVLLAYLEFKKLVRLTSDACRTVDFQRPKDGDQKLLEAHREEILNFRLNYRFSQASQIDHHNKYYSAWRGSFGCDQLLVELSSDINEVDDYLTYKLEQKRLLMQKEQLEAETHREAFRQQIANDNERKYNYFGIFFAAMVLLVGLLGSNLKEYQDKTIDHPVIWGTILVVCLLGLAAFVMRWRMDRRIR